MNATEGSRALAAGGMFAIALARCLAGVFYSGDGRLIDHGPSAFDERYVLDLGGWQYWESW